MDKFLIGGWLLVAVVVATTQAVPQYQHLYLGYVSPFEFLQGLRHNAGYNSYQAYRNKRSTMMGDHMDYGYHNEPSSAPHHHQDHDPMPAYTPSFHYNPMMYPYKMFTYPSMKFPSMPKFQFPTMPSYHFPSFNNYHHPMMPSYNTGYKPASAYQPSSSASNPPHNNHPFGDHFMKMMGFHSGDNHGSSASNNNYQATNHGNSYAYNNNNGNHGNHGGNNNNNYNNPKGNKNYEMSYSNSYSMNMDYNNGKGHMVTKDSSYMNDNGKVYRNDGPEKHYMSHGDGKFMPVNNYNPHN